MTHHHVIMSTSNSNFNTARSDATRQDHNSSQTVQDVRAIIQSYCSQRTIIQEQSKVHYYSALLHF